MIREAFSREGASVIAKLSLLYLFVAMFWALYEQTGAAWVLQAEQMDRHLLSWFEPVERWLVASGVSFVDGWSQVQVKAAQVQAVNPLLIMVLIPLFTYAVYPGINTVVRLTPLRKIATGMFLTVAAFAVSAYAEWLIVNAAAPPTIWWQGLAFILLTIAELMVSITCLEFSYTQAPPRMKSLIMGLYLLSNAVGNIFTAAVNFLIQNEDGTTKLPGPAYYWFFAGLMLATSVLFSIYSLFYREKSYIQQAAEPMEAAAEERV